MRACFAAVRRVLANGTIVLAAGGNGVGSTGDGGLGEGDHLSTCAAFHEMRPGALFAARLALLGQPKSVDSDGAGGFVIGDSQFNV